MNMYPNTFYKNKCLPSEVKRLQQQCIGPLQDCSSYDCLYRLKNVNIKKTVQQFSKITVSDFTRVYGHAQAESTHSYLSAFPLFLECLEKAESTSKKQSTSANCSAYYQAKLFQNRWKNSTLCLALVQTSITQEL